MFSKNWTKTKIMKTLPKQEKKRFICLHYDFAKTTNVDKSFFIESFDLPNFEKMAF